MDVCMYILLTKSKEYNLIVPKPMAMPVFASISAGGPLVLTHRPCYAARHFSS